MSKLEKNKKEIIEKIIEVVKERLEGESSGHDWWHTYRVYKNSIKIAKSEELAGDFKIDFFILEMAALLHDIADHKFGYSDDDRVSIIREILSTNGVEEVDILKVINIVNNVSFSKGNIPTDIEGKIVQDADRLDALGAIGIARTFAYGGSKGREMYVPENSDGNDSIYHFYEKLLLLKDKMNTNSGKLFATERDEFMKKFLEEFYSEWEVK